MPTDPIHCATFYEYVVYSLAWNSTIFARFLNSEDLRKAPGDKDREHLKKELDKSDANAQEIDPI